MTESSSRRKDSRSAFSRHRYPQRLNTSRSPGWNTVLIPFHLCGFKAQAFWGAVEAGYATGLADYEMTDAVIAALSAFESDYPGLAEKVRRDISSVYLQVEEANF